jgi:hypothetical protein
MPVPLEKNPALLLVSTLAVVAQMSAPSGGAVLALPTSITPCAMEELRIITISCRPPEPAR